MVQTSPSFFVILIFDAVYSKLLIASLICTNKKVVTDNKKTTFMFSTGQLIDTILDPTMYSYYTKLEPGRK